MSSRPELRIAWAAAEAARYACEQWHYSRTVPVGKTVKIGAWEAGRFIGVVLFAWGANKSLGSPYGLEMTECCELVRIALARHEWPVTKIVAVALKLLKCSNPGLRLVVSFADPEAGHHGGIYQGGNWVYCGTSAPSFEWRIGKTRLNKRAFTGQQFGGGKSSVAELPANAQKVQTRGKHRYLMPLDDDIRKQIEPLRKPYPKRVRSVENDTPAIQAGEGGANPTRTLQNTGTPQE